MLANHVLKHNTIKLKTFFFFFFLKLLRQSVTVRLLSENCLKLPGFFIYFKCFALNAFNSIYLPNTPFFQ